MATSLADHQKVSTSSRRGLVVAPQGEGGYDMCWYPVGLSNEVEAGKIVVRPFLNGRVVVWRGENGLATVSSPFCRHMGASLEVGEVVGDEIRCAFHFWQYGQDGRCTKIPASSTVPSGAKLFTFPTVEKWGVIWAFNGLTPTYEVPGFLGVDESEILYKPFRSDPHPGDPFLSVINTVDLQHLQVVHHIGTADGDIKLDVGRHGITDIRFKMEIPGQGWCDHWMEIWGTNGFTFRDEHANGFEMLTMCFATPLPDGSNQPYVISAQRRPGDSPEAIAQTYAAIDGMLAMGKEIGMQDMPIFETISFRQDHLIPADRLSGTVLQYVKGYCRSDEASDFLR